MARLSKRQSKLHTQATEILNQDVLSLEDREFIINNWHEGAGRNSQALGAFFTPPEMAAEFAYFSVGDIYGDGVITVIDLCAGIGSLGYAIKQRYEDQVNLICVELNHSFCEVGKKLVPNATWINADITDEKTIEELKDFNADRVVSNPPFGSISSLRNGQRYNKANAEFLVADIASELAPYSSFIVPQGSAGFAYSGQIQFKDEPSNKYLDFVEQTGIEFNCGMGIDTTCYDEFKDTKITVEFVDAEYTQRKAAPKQIALWG